jgi:ubiquinone/menaquinone biosynthesis C-methylase UbiE
MIKYKIWEQVQYWWAGCLAYTNPIFPLALKRRETLFLRTVEAICVYKEHGTILDVGTGSGRLLLLLAKVAPEIKCIGIDINPILLRKARQISTEKHLSNRISFLQADVQALPFADQSIDLAVSVASLHQWHNREDGVKELYRVLKNGGIILILLGIGLMWLFDFFKRNLVNRRDLEMLFKAVGFKDVMLARVGVKDVIAKGAESEVFLIFGRK